MKKILNKILIIASMTFLYLGLSFGVTYNRDNNDVEIEYLSNEYNDSKRLDLTDAYVIPDSAVEFINPTKDSITVRAVTNKTLEDEGMEDYYDFVHVNSLNGAWFFIDTDQGTFYASGYDISTWVLNCEMSVEVKISGLNYDTTYTNVVVGWEHRFTGTVIGRSYYENSTENVTASGDGFVSGDGYDFDGDGTIDLGNVEAGTTVSPEYEFTTLGDNPTLDIDDVIYSTKNNELTYVLSLTSPSSINSINIEISDVNDSKNTYTYEVNVADINKGINLIVVDYKDVGFYETNIHSSIEMTYTDVDTLTEESITIEYASDIEIGPEPIIEPKEFTMHPKLFAAIAITIVIIMLVLVLIL